MMRLTSLAMIVATAVSTSQPAHADEGVGMQQSMTLDVPVQIKMKYLLYLPEDYANQDAWPLILFLHGAGERGENLELVKTHGPPKLIAQGKAFPSIVVSPQCVADRWWEPVELTALLDDLVSRYKIDQRRIYVTGLSMGGFGTWRLAAFTPDRFAAIAPICGGADTFQAKLIAHVPTWVFHGAKDNVVPLERSEQMVDALHKAKSKPIFTIYPDAGHDSWTETYNNPELYSWFFKHQLPERK